MTTRDLEPSELAGLVARLGARPDTWRPLVRYEAGRRRFEELSREDHVEVWVVSWMGRHDTGYRDHDPSCGAVAVVEGSVVEERLTVGQAPVARPRKTGDRFHFGASHVHRLYTREGARAVTIHAYSPPLRQIGAYAFGPKGELHRVSLPALDGLHMHPAESDHE